MLLASHQSQSLPVLWEGYLKTRVKIRVKTRVKTRVKIRVILSHCVHGTLNKLGALQTRRKELLSEPTSKIRKK